MDISRLVPRTSLVLYAIKDQMETAVTTNQKKVHFLIIGVFVALASIGIYGIYRIFKAKKINKSEVKQDPEVKINYLLTNIKKDMRFRMQCPDEQIHSAKIFIDISGNQSKVSREKIIKRSDEKCLNFEFFLQEIDIILKQAKESMKSGVDYQICWNLLMKGNKSFYLASGTRYSERGKESTDTIESFSAENFTNVCNVMLEETKREIKPQLDAHGEFIPFRKNKVIFERVKAPEFNDRK